MKNTIESLSNIASGIGLIGLSVAGIGLLMPSKVQAADITFQITWSGSYFFNTASAVGYFTIDSALLPNPGNTPTNFSTPNISIDNPSDPDFNAKSPITALIKSLSLTVTGSGLGDGTYTLDDYAGGGVIWNTNGANLDFTQELVGQKTQGLPWGSIVSTPPGDKYSDSYLNPANYGGDFNIFDAPTCVPTGVETFVLATCSASGDTKLLRLTSFKPVNVPVPGVLFGIVAAGGLMSVSKRKKKLVSANLTKAID